MGFESKIVLTIVYAILAVAFSIYTYLKIRRRGGMGAIDYFNIYYLLVYFIVPIFFFYNNYVGFKGKYAIFLDYDLKYHILALLCAVVFFVLTNVFYNKIRIKSDKSLSVNVRSKRFLILNIIFSMIGIFSYYMWTKIYGFPFGILKYADMIRDNVIAVNNPYAFFQPLSNFAIFAAYNWLVLLKSYSKFPNKVMAAIMFTITFFFSILAAFATDGRFTIIILFLVPVLYFVGGKKFDLKKILIFGLIAIFALGKIDSLTSSIRGEVYKKADASNVFESISHEFGFTYSNRINLLYNFEHSNVKVSEWDDLKNIFFSWVPSTMKPENLQTLAKYNTSFYMNSSGEMPTDIVTAALYKGRVFGLLFLPLFIAFVLKFFDSKFSKGKDGFVRMFYLYFCVAVMLRVVAYYEMSSLLFGRLAFIVYYLIIFVACSERIKLDDRLGDGEKINDEVE